MRIFKKCLPLITALIILSLSANILAATKSSGTPTPPNVAQSVTRSYSADNTVQVGMFVRLKDKDPNIVVPVESSQFSKLLGVVVPAASASIMITPNQINQQQVLVATSGRVSVLVSNQNGIIKVGDDVTLSSIDGVTMAAGNGEENIVGKAVSGYNGNTNTISKVNVKDQSGKQKSVNIGRIVIDINVSKNPAYKKQSDYVPGVLSSVATTVAGRPVSVVRIYLSVAVLIAVVVIVGNLLYAGVRTGMIAVGRNPLSKKSVIRSLVQTSTVGLIIFIAGVFGVYLILKL